MTFEVGQRVVITKNLGTKPGNEANSARDKYFYGVNIRDIPLGSKGVIVKLCNNHYKIKVGSENLCLADGEYVTYTQYTEEEQRRFNSLLEGALLEEAPTVTRTKSEERSFNPKFNAKDEFVVWIRQEFPKIEKYARSGTQYEPLVERIDEVKNAAKIVRERVQAMNPAVYRQPDGSMDNCKTRHLKYYFDKFEKSGPNEQLVALENLVRALQISGKKYFPYVSLDGVGTKIKFEELR